MNKINQFSCLADYVYSCKMVLMSNFDIFWHFLKLLNIIW